MRHPWRTACAAAVLVAAGAACAAAVDIACRARFGPHIEGAAVDAAGNLFAVNWDRRYDSVGKLDAATRTCAPTAAATSGGTTVIGLRVLPGGQILAAAPSARAVLVLQPGGGGAGKGPPARTFCSDPKMVAPNDLAISPKTGYVYVSGQSWKPEGAVGDGDVWLCRRAGAPAVRLAQMGRTNGIEVSGDGAYLFVSESFNKGGSPVSNVIWRYPIAADGTLDAARRALVADFAKVDGTARFDVDGMRLDSAGRLHVTRNGAGYITVLDPLGTNRVTGKIPLPFSSPTNLEFGGPDGKTLFVVGRCGVGTPWGQGDGCIEAVRVAAAGLYWSNLQRGLPRVQL